MPTNKKQFLVLCFVGLLGFGSSAAAQTAKLSYTIFYGTPGQTVEINNLSPNGPSLRNSDYFGTSVEDLGDLNGDGINDLAVGARYDDAGGFNRGTVHVFFMNADSSVSSRVEINSNSLNGPTLRNVDQFGYAMTNLGDLNGDGVNDLAVGAKDDDAGGSNQGTIHILYLNSDGRVGSTVEINDNTPNGPSLSLYDRFGSAVENIGDLDGNGVNDLAVGATGDDTGGTTRGTVHICFLNADGSVINTVEINSNTPNGPSLLNNDEFGTSIANLGDLDGNGVNDLAVGARGDDAGGSNRGAVHICYLNADGSVSSTVEINSNTPNGPVLSDADSMGRSLTNLGDLNGDGVNDLALGATGDDDAGGINRGAVYICYLNADGSISSTIKINDNTLNGPSLLNNDAFGIGLTKYRDNSIAVGASGDDAGGSDRGAVHILSFATVYEEVVANDGILDNSTPLLINLVGDTFVGVDGGTLAIGTDVVVGNVPEGLSPVFTIGNNQTTVTLTFTGQATYHQDVDNITNLTFQFTDAAFSTAPAADVENSGSATPYSSNAAIDFRDNANTIKRYMRNGKHFFRGELQPMGFE